jgi:hypothetical protein
MKYWHPHLLFGQYISVSTLVYIKKKQYKTSAWIKDKFVYVVKFSNLTFKPTRQIWHFEEIPIIKEMFAKV